MLWIQTPRPTRFLLLIPGALSLAFALNGDTVRAQTERSIPTTPAQTGMFTVCFSCTESSIGPSLV